MKRLSWNDRKETCDTLFEGRLRAFQKREGYRFSVDALLLAHFAEAGPKDRIIDLGTGCGIVPLILTFRGKASHVIGVEIQPSLADLARRNAALNRYASRIKIWEKDLKDLITKKLQGTFDLVLSNPPYRKMGSGRINPHEEKAVARHEIKATLEDVLRVAHYLLRDKGRLAMIYPASRVADLIRKMAGFHLEPKRLQFVHSHAADEARLVLVEALKEGHTQVKVLPPLFLYDSGGNYTSIARELFR
jgi:tRNA1Val (adenine37-N6)-methyltransferase